MSPTSLSFYRHRLPDHRDLQRRGHLLVHAEIATLFSLLIEALHLNADSRLIHELVLKVDALQPHSVLLAGLVSLGYAGMLLVEGIGLWLEFTWAAYLTVVSTSLLLPFELYEVIKRVSMLRIGVLLLNLVIVGILEQDVDREAASPLVDRCVAPACARSSAIRWCARVGHLSRLAAFGPLVIPIAVEALVNNAG